MHLFVHNFELSTRNRDHFLMKKFTFLIIKFTFINLKFCLEGFWGFGEPIGNFCNVFVQLRIAGRASVRVRGAHRGGCAQPQCE